MSNPLPIETRIKQLRAIVVSKYERVKDHVKLDAKLAKDVLKDQLEIEMVWSELYKEAKLLKSMAEESRESKFSEVVRDLMVKDQRMNSFTEAKEFAKHDQDYRNARFTEIDATDLYTEVSEVVKILTSRKYTMHNLVSLITSGTDSHIL